jgi:hypothetical protein
MIPYCLSQEPGIVTGYYPVVSFDIVINCMFLCKISGPQIGTWSWSDLASSRSLRIQIRIPDTDCSIFFIIGSIVFVDISPWQLLLLQLTLIHTGLHCVCVYESFFWVFLHELYRYCTYMNRVLRAGVLVGPANLHMLDHRSHPPRFSGESDMCVLQGVRAEQLTLPSQYGQKNYLSHFKP